MANVGVDRRQLGLRALIAAGVVVVGCFRLWAIWGAEPEAEPAVTWVGPDDLPATSTTVPPGYTAGQVEAFVRGLEGDLSGPVFADYVPPAEDQIVIAAQLCDAMDQRVGNLGPPPSTLSIVEAENLHRVIITAPPNPAPYHGPLINATFTNVGRHLCPRHLPAFDQLVKNHPYQDFS